jgi:formate--tetrahydrofolate ligase
MRALETGMANVRRHLAIVNEFGVPCVVAVNRRPGDSDEEVQMVRKLALESGAFAAEVNEGFEKGGIGSADLASAVVDACEQPHNFNPLYPDNVSVREKIERVATRIYGARDVFFYPEAEQRLEQFERDGLGHFPVCMAKTHLSLSADPALLNAPEDFRLTVRDIRAYTGAGWLVPLCGDITQMPGLGKTPAALNVDIDENGRTVGLF